jgi:putative sterol carrier protein
MAHFAERHKTMSEILEQAVTAITEKLGGTGISGSAKFSIEGVGAVIVDGSGARICDEEADVTLSADLDTFQDMMSGDLNPTSAFMTGKLKVDGDMGLAMQLASSMA